MTMVCLQVYSHHKTHNTTSFFWRSVNFNFEQHDTLLLHKHLLTCSQKNTIMSFSRLKKNCLLLYFLGIATPPPLPKCATGHIVSLENFHSNVYKGTMFRKKNSPKQIALGGVNQIPMVVHENNYCGVQQALSHGAQATGT